MNGRDIDIAILGGGLAGGLLALTLAEVRPESSLLLIERDQAFGGNHVWSCFDSDIAPEDERLIEALTVAKWEGYDVHFPGHSREIATPYRSMTGERLDARLREVLPAEALMAATDVVSASAQGLTLSDGSTIRAGGVIDARGASGLPHLTGGWQKFMGHMLKLEAPHGLSRPVVMDARVEQTDGYRFVYCLPFNATEIFVEDTYYADTPDLDQPALRKRIARYADARGWRIASVSREETGVLPVVAGGDFEAFWKVGEPVARAGARAALIHPLTSYSLPDALRFARHIARLNNLSGAGLAKASYEWSQEHWRKGRFYRMLANLLFSAALPQERYRILERFYRLPTGLIERFYSGRTSRGDAVRILAGRPPVPLGAAVASLSGHGRPLASLDAPG